MSSGGYPRDLEADGEALARLADDERFVSLRRLESGALEVALEDRGAGGEVTIQVGVKLTGATPGAAMGAALKVLDDWGSDGG